MPWQGHQGHDLDSAVAGEHAEGGGGWEGLRARSAMPQGLDLKGIEVRVASVFMVEAGGMQTYALLTHMA